jgi:hypothetical protein
MENLDKTYESKLSGKRKAVGSGQTVANLAKQNWQKNLLLYKNWKRRQDRKSFDGSYIDMDNAENTAVMRIKAVILGSRKL